MRELFHSRPFLAYFAGSQAGWMGRAIEDVAIGWQVFSLRHQPFDLGIVGLMLFLPQLLLALPAGMLADRADRRAICIAVAIAHASSAAVFIALIARHVTALAPYYAVTALVGVCYAIGSPPRRAMMASIVTGGLFVRASAVTSSISQLVSIAGPALAGICIAISAPLGFLATIAFQTASAVAFVLLPSVRSHDRHAETGSQWTAALQGVRYVFERKLVLGAISLDLFAVLFGGATALLPAIATQILHVGPVGFGMLRAAPAAGAAAVAAVMVRHPIERRAGPLLLLCVAGFGAFTIAFGLSHNVWISTAALALTGGFDMVSMVIRGALVQLRTPDRLRGRVNAVESIFIGASNELGAFESGTLAAVAGTQASVVIGGVATLVVIALWSILFPSLRELDRLHE